MSETVVDQKKIFKEVIDCYGSGIILMHNHPSGNNKPSESDIRITGKIVEAAKLFDIKVLDHLIITGESDFSFTVSSMA
ncbi:JAB domain-containing protein [Bacteroidota bacterium]